MRELDVAEVFLREGLIRNASGKAVQAWKSAMSYLALNNLELLRGKYTGYKRVGRYSIPLHEWIAVVMPTNRMTEVSTLIANKVPEVIELTTLALQLHEYQYNGPDPEGIRSKVPNDETAKRLVEALIARARSILGPLNTQC
ncbi:MAG: PaREP1 family protein [Vulcanisaeta sp.]|nr:PaREP1 family protein [Vulcanisaeta sp.]